MRTENIIEKLVDEAKGKKRLTRQRERRLIYQKTKAFARFNSFYDRKEHELVFVGTPTDCALFILASVPEICVSEPPDLPQGTVLRDIQGTGFLQRD